MPKTREELFEVVCSECGELQEVEKKEIEGLNFYHSNKECECGGMQELRFKDKQAPESATKAKSRSKIKNKPETKDK